MFYLFILLFCLLGVLCCKSIKKKKKLAECPQRPLVLWRVVSTESPWRKQGQRSHHQFVRNGKWVVKRVDANVVVLFLCFSGDWNLSHKLRRMYFQDNICSLLTCACRDCFFFYCFTFFLFLIFTLQNHTSVVHTKLLGSVLTESFNFPYSHKTEPIISIQTFVSYLYKN